MSEVDNLRIQKLEEENRLLRSEIKRLNGNAEEIAKKWARDLIAFSLDMQIDVRDCMTSGKGQAPL